jgi:PH (Pleckstrin Homology) domain-containing protein
MNQQGASKSFALAPMSPAIWWFSVVLMVVAAVLIALAALGKPPGPVPALLVVAVYAWIWLGFRPQRFIVHVGALELVWPLRRQIIPRKQITGARLIDRSELRNEIGWGIRIGAGGLWGAFGWLWTQRRGLIRFYISRTDGLVWIERAGKRPLLITPERPAEFVRAMQP